VAAVDTLDRYRFHVDERFRLQADNPESTEPMGTAQHQFTSIWQICEPITGHLVPKL
jgi:hypothetical protein